MARAIDAKTTGPEDAAEYARYHKEVFPRLIVSDLSYAGWATASTIPVKRRLTKTDIKVLIKIKSSLEASSEGVQNLLFGRESDRKEIDDARLRRLTDEMRLLFDSVFTTKNVPRELYDDLRREWLKECPTSVPIAVLAHENVLSLKRNYEDLKWRHPDRSSVMYFDLDYYDGLLEVAQRALQIRSSGWTGKRSVTEQARYIRHFAPLALTALDDLIRLHELLADNRTLSPDEERAIAALKRLHSDLGKLLAAVEAGRSFKGLTKALQKAARLCFSMAGEAKDVLIAGTPAVAAATIPCLGVIGALELCGVEVNLTGAAIAFGVNASVYGKVSAEKRKAAGLQ